MRSGSVGAGPVAGRRTSTASRKYSRAHSKSPERAASRPFSKMAPARVIATYSGAGRCTAAGRRPFAEQATRLATRHKRTQFFPEKTVGFEGIWKKGYCRGGAKSKTFFECVGSRTSAGSNVTGCRRIAAPRGAPAARLFSENLELQGEDELLEVLRGLERNRERLLVPDASVVSIGELQRHRDVVTRGELAARDVHVENTAHFLPVVQAVREQVVDRHSGAGASRRPAGGGERGRVLPEPLELRKDVDVGADADVLDALLRRRRRLSALRERDRVRLELDLRGTGVHGPRDADGLADRRSREGDRRAFRLGHFTGRRDGRPGLFDRRSGAFARRGRRRSLPGRRRFRSGWRRGPRRPILSGHSLLERAERETR